MTSTLIHTDLTPTTMSTDARTAAPAAFYRYPARRAVAVTDNAPATAALLDGLEADGVDLAQIETISGADGRRRLDKDGTHHGVFARLQRRLIAALSTDSENIVVQLDAVLAQGGHLVVVPLAPAGAPAELDVEAALFAHGASHVVRFGRWTVQTAHAPRHAGR
jgi:hypothetical protein